MKKLLCAVLSATLAASAIVMPAAAADKNTETVTYRYDNGNWIHTREMEKLGRGLVAIKSGSDVYLSWRLLDSEDHIFGSADKNVSFNIYSGSTKIGAVADKTNYTVTDGDINAVYSVAPVIDGVEGTKETAIKNMKDSYFDINLSDYTPEPQYLPRTISLLASDGKGYNYIASTDAPAVIPDNTYAADVDYYVSDLHDENTAYQYYYYTINDCSVGDVDGDGEYEIIVKWDCNGQDNSQGGVTGDVILDAYETDGTQLWRINLGKNIRAGAHYTQFLVYDFDGDGKAEMTCKTAPGSTDSKGTYVTKKSRVNEIKSISDTINGTDYRAGSGFITTGDEYLTIFSGETGEAIDTIYYPNQRIDPYIWGDRPQDSGGNRVDRFTAAVAYIDGVKPYAVYMRGYYMRQSGGYSERQAACAVSFDGSKLDCKYSFDTYNPDNYTSSNKTKYSSFRSNGTYKGVNGYVSGNEAFVGEGNHNCAVADVDNDGKDEVMTGALCYELKDNDILGVKWCTFLEHGDALHIGDYDPTHQGFEFFNVQEDSGPNTKGGSEVKIGYGMTVVDPGIDSINSTDSAYDDLIMFHESASADTGRGVMANIGMGGYYQIWSSKNELRIANGGKTYTPGSKTGLAQNFRIFWDGDLYDELLDGIADDDDVSITSYNTSTKKIEQLLLTEGCATANSTKKTPALTADIFGDWREELIVRKDDNSGLRVYSTTTPSDYKIKTLMQDPVYRSGVAAEQTAYNQPPHVGFYLAEEAMKGSVTSISVVSTKNSYKVGENIDKSTLTVTATYKNGESAVVDSYDITGYDPNTAGAQEVTVYYSGSRATFNVTVESGFDIDSNGIITGYHGTSTTETIPSSIDGVEVSGIGAGALTSSGITKLYVRIDPITIANNSLPAGITIACYEDSDAYNYAVANNIKYELLKPAEYLVNINFDESPYNQYSNGEYIVYQHEKQAWTTTLSPITYGVGSRSNGNGGDGNTGVWKITDGSNSYIYGRAGQFNSNNRHAYMLFDNASKLKNYSEYTLSFDFQIPSNTTNMTMAIMSSSDGKYKDATKTTDDANVIYAFRAGKDSVAANTWYHYEYSYSNGAYSQTITSADGTTTLSPSITNEAVPMSIAFRSDGANANVYLDNLAIAVPLVTELALHITDKNGAAVPNASVSLDSGTPQTTNSDGNVTFAVEGGRHTVIASHPYIEDAINTTVSVYAANPSKTLSFEGELPSQNCKVISVTGETVKVNVPEPEGVMIFAVHYLNGALSDIQRLIPEKSYENTFTNVYNTDAVYIWSKEMEPLAIWRGADNLYTVTVTVTDTNGSAAENISVLLSDRGRQLGGDDEEGNFELAASSYSTRITTDANGVAKFENVPFGSGSYSVFAFKNGVASSNSTSSFRLYYNTNVSLSLTVN